MEGTKQVDQKV